MATANRGKSAEKSVKDWMTARSDADARFAFHRHPDPHAGSLQPVPADYEVMYSGQHYLIEVKEVKAAAASGSRRLPQANFSADKVARMRKWHIAGSSSWVLVHHTAVGEWRMIPVHLFAPPRPASWNITSYAVKTLNEHMETLFGARP